MTPQEMAQILQDTRDDDKLSRGERRALGDIVEGWNGQQRALFRRKAFELAKIALAAGEGPEVLDWLEGVVKAIDKGPDGSLPSVEANAYFSPGLHCLERIQAQLENAQRYADICVFTITDNRIARKIIEAKDRGVRVRIVTDNDKSLDRGSDIEKLERAGVPVRVDQTEHHMHHKFAVFDRKTLLSGSYNWTRSAAEFNSENIVVTDHPSLVASFSDAFDALWTRLDS